jgi:DNA processing protein
MSFSLGNKEIINYDHANDIIDILRLARSENVGPRTFYDLMKFFGTASNALKYIPEFSIKGGRSKPITIYPEKDAIKEIKLNEKFGSSLISYKDKNYPKLLKYIGDAPPIISCLGDSKILSKSSVSIVGARNASLNARAFSNKIASKLVEAGFCVVSGLASGIDTEAHKGAISSTIGVIAGGIDHIYPAENAKLYSEIRNNGAIIAELPIGSSPVAKHFPQRNRIISGMSRATIVIEASLKSGSLITARLALEQDREVCAVPGFPLDYRSHGTNRLIKDGAFVVESIDGLVDLLIKLENSQNSFSDSEEQRYNVNQKFALTTIDDSMRKQLLSLLSPVPTSIDELYKESGLSFPALYTIILEFELAGKILRHHGNKISLNY